MVLRTLVSSRLLPSASGGRPSLPHAAVLTVRPDDWRENGRDDQWQRRSQVSVFTPLLAVECGRSPRPPGQSRRARPRCRSSHLAADAGRHFRHPAADDTDEHHWRMVSPPDCGRRRGRRRGGGGGWPPSVGAAEVLDFTPGASEAEFPTPRGGRGRLCRSTLG